MSKIQDGSVAIKGIQYYFGKDSIKEVISLARTGEYMNNPTDYLNILISGHKKLISNDGGLIDLVKSILKNNKITTLEEIILKDVISVLTTDEKESFDKYVGLVDNENTKSRKTSNFKVTIIKDRKIVRSNNEMSYLFNKLGIRETAMMLICLDKIVSTR